jgi:hypothetical protein
MNKRPGGITFLGILFIVLGIFSLCWSGFILSIGAFSASFGDLMGAMRLGTFGANATWQGAIGLVAAVVQIVVGGGLLALKRWAWILAFVAIALNIAQGVVGMFGGGFFAICCGAFWLLIPLAILVYLLTPGVRLAFGHVPPAAPPPPTPPPAAVPPAS